MQGKAVVGLGHPLGERRVEVEVIGRWTMISKVVNGSCQPW